MLLLEGLARPLKLGRPCVELWIENAGLSMISMLLQGYLSSGKKGQCHVLPEAGQVHNAHETELNIRWPYSCLCSCIEDHTPAVAVQWQPLAISIGLSLRLVAHCRCV